MGEVSEPPSVSALSSYPTTHRVLFQISYLRQRLRQKEDKMKARSFCLVDPSSATTLSRYCPVLLSLVLLSADLWAQSGAWTRKKDMPTGRAAPCAAVVNNKIYVIGGVDKDVVGLADYEVYDPSTDTWEVKKPLPTPRGFVSAA